MQHLNGVKECMKAFVCKTDTYIFARSRQDAEYPNLRFHIAVPFLDYVNIDLSIRFVSVFCYGYGVPVSLYQVDLIHLVLRHL